MHHLQRPEGRIAYDLYGPTDRNRPLIVCVTGMFDHRASFRFVGEALAEAGHRVAVMDLRGHGDSDTTFTEHTNRAAATDAIALAEELGGENVLMVGNSLGGAAVTIAAMERPDLVAGIALLCPFLRHNISPLLRLGFQILLLRPWGPGVLAYYYDKLHVGRTPEGHTEQKRRVRDMLRPADRFRSIAATVLAPSEQVLAAPGLRAAATVVVGEQDPDWPDPAAEAEWVASVVGGTVETVPDCGHYPQSQQPDAVVSAVLRLAERAKAGA
ncbi:alpha/beta fold hydrolase [Nocardiopsis sp. LOL_012]|uniref:alpha/beta fold hydrolase n=1 Tax=Nocardiopsis sp. LOL_012 TaxID=3345409 RepID=UPI003A8777EC